MVHMAYSPNIDIWFLFLKHMKGSRCDTNRNLKFIALTFDWEDEQDLTNGFWLNLVQQRNLNFPLSIQIFLIIPRLKLNSVIDAIWKILEINTFYFNGPIQIDLYFRLLSLLKLFSFSCLLFVYIW